MVAAAARFVAVHGEPFGDAAALPLTVLAEAARPHLKVVLTGEGADEVFGGYGRYRISRRVGSPLQRAAQPALVPVARWWGERRGDAPWERALEALAWGGGMRSHAALLGADLTALLNHHVPYAVEVDGMAQADWYASTNGDDGEPEVARRFDRTRWLANTYLEKVDRATMASGLEARVPYLDAGLAAASARLPIDPNKAALRHDLYRRLPGVALPPRKRGLAVSLRQLLASGLERHARRMISSRDSVLASSLGTTALDTLARRAQHSTLTTFRLAMLGQWEETLGSAGLL
jgi:asparagine synthase (glutamine-hydrolysing)